MKIEVPAFDNVQILVVGDVMLDRYWQGPTGRISPEAPVPVVKVEHNEDRPGGAANVALNIRALGGRCQLIGLAGKDEPGRVLRQALEAVAVDCNFVTHDDLPTITKLRVLSRNQQLIRLDFEEPFHNVSPEPLLEQVDSALKHCQLVILSDYNKGALAAVEKIIQRARELGVPVLVDPKGTKFEKYRGATLLTPNMGEFEAVVGHCPDEQAVVERGLKLIEELELDALLITRSEKGMTLLRPGPDGEAGELHLPAQAHEVFDVTGAGDTVIATLASALAAGMPLDKSTAIANAAAGVVVGKLGAATVTPIQLADALGQGQESGFGVIGEQQLKFAVELAKQRGEKIVMTNGCFDILHAGHVSYLSQARALGDRLIVAVNDDASVEGLKGPGRPVNPVSRRMAVLSGLEAVDWVVSFSEDTPERLISEVLPDLLVKGGDYEVEQIAGHKQVLANGGDVRILNFEQGCSTTEIINSIRKR